MHPLVPELKPFVHREILDGQANDTSTIDALDQSESTESTELQDNDIDIAFE